MNVLSYGIRMWAQVSFVLSQCTCLTDRPTERPLQYHALQYMQWHGKNTTILQS